MPLEDGSIFADPCQYVEQELLEIDRTGKFVKQNGTSLLLSLNVVEEKEELVTTQ